VEAARQLVVHAAASHTLERAVDDLAGAVVRGVMPPVQEEGERAGVRELRLAAEPAVYRVEHLRDGLFRLLEKGWRRLPRSAVVQVGVQHLPDRLGLRLDLAPPGAVRVQHAREHRAEPGLAVLRLRRKVGAAEEHVALGSQEGCERPTALAGERLDRALVARVHVGPLVPVHLDADEVLVEVTGDAGIVVGLAVHDVAPVAPHGPDVEQHRAILVAGRREGFVAPGVPVDRLMGGGPQIGGGGGRESVRCHGRKLAVASPTLVICVPKRRRAHRSAPSDPDGRSGPYLWLREYT
jgi:hypothetical protein